MATVVTSSGAQGVTITGTGYTGTRAVVTVQFTSTDNRRRYVETHHVPVVGGAINYVVPMAFSGGTVVARAFHPTTNVLDGTSTNQAV